MEESPSRLPMPSQLPKRDASKRRSLLLPPGTIAAGLRKVSPSSAEEDAPKPQQRQRPMTMFGGAPPRTLQTTREEAEQDDDDDDVEKDGDDSRSPSPESREAARASAHAALMGGGGSGSSSSNNSSSRIQAPASIGAKTGIARSTSIRAPGTSRIGTNRVLEQPRTKIGARPVSMIKESTSRPQSVASSASKSSAEAPASRLRAPVSSTSATTAIATTTATAGLRRLNTTASSSTARHTRTQSNLPPPSSKTQAITTRRHPTISEGTTTTSDPRLHRPAFSTLQQHYSPKKNLAPKPASASLIHATPPDTSSSNLPLESQFLQTRLLQLALLHKQAEPTFQAWTRSARRALKHKFTDVAAECEVVRAKERELRRKENIAALRGWCNGDMGMLGELVNTLSSVLGEVMRLLDEEGGRVNQALEIFEAWITWVEAVYAGREQQGRRHAEFIDGLGDGWKAEVASLIRKLQGLVRQLDGLGRVEECGKESSLVEMVDGLKALTRNAVEELRLVDRLEAEVVKREARWVDEQVADMVGDVDALLT